MSNSPLGPYRVLSEGMLSENEGFSVQVSGFNDSPSRSASGRKPHMKLRQNGMVS